MTAKLCSALLAFAALTGVLAAQPAPKPLDDKKLVTKVYDIKPLLGEGSKASGVAVADADAVIKLIFEAIPQLHDLKADDPHIIERDNGKLEIRTTAARHSEIADLFEAIKRLQDLAIDVKAEVIELDAAAYEKFAKALPNGKTKAPVLFAIGEEAEGKENPGRDKAIADAFKLLKTGRVVQTSSNRFVNGAEATLAARLSVVTFHPGIANDKPTGTPQFVKEGFRLAGTPLVSRDRRYVRFKLTEQSLAVTGTKKVDLGEVIDKQRLVLQTLETQDMGATGSAVVPDGGTLIFRLAYAPKDQVWVVVLKPVIYIQSEEEALKKEGKPPKP